MGQEGAFWLAVIDCVEGVETEPVDQREGRREGDVQQSMRLRGLAGPGPGRREIAAEEDTPAQVGPTRGAIDPGDGEFMGPVGLLGEREEVAEVRETPALGLNPGTGDGAQLDFHPGDKSGQPQPAEGGGEPVGVFGRCADPSTAIRAHQFKGPDMVAEGAGAVMVLAVDIIGHRPAQGHEAGAGGDRQKPPTRDDQFQDLGQQHAGLGAEHTGIGIKGDEAVQAPRQQDMTAVVEADVAIAAP